MGKRAADYRELLRAGRWFRGLPSGLQDGIIGIGVVKEVSPKQVLFLRGQAGDGMYGVLEGQLRASGTDDDGNQAILTIVEPPTWVGEIPIFDGRPRTHDLFGETEALVLFVPQAALLACLAKEPAYWMDLARLLTAKLRLAFTGLEDSHLLPVSARLVRRLVLIAEGYGEWADGTTREVVVSQETLATLLSTSRQTVNQHLKVLETEGLVRLRRPVEIIDRTPPVVGGFAPSGCRVNRPALTPSFGSRPKTPLDNFDRAP